MKSTKLEFIEKLKSICRNKQRLDNNHDKPPYSNLTLKETIIYLLSLYRFDIDPLDNGEFIELSERIESDGKYIKFENILTIINDWL